MESARATAALRLSAAQNKLLAVDLLVSSVTAVSTFGALVAAVFGMNLRSGKETAPRWFWAVFALVAGGAPLVILLLLWRIRSRGLLIS